MADHPIDILLRARDQASKQIRGVTGSLKTMGRLGGQAVRNLTTNLVRLGTVGVVTLAGGVALGARSLEELERVTNQTNAVIESTGGAAKVSAAEVRDLAQKLETLTTADDKAIQGGQNLLLTFTSIGKDVFPQASDAMVNMAIAMAQGDVASADFKGTAIQLGKALNDPARGFTALRRAGVSFTKDQETQIKALVKAGKVTKAQQIILAELEKEFGKAGEAAGTGFGADLRRMQDAGEDASQALARGLLPVISRAATWLQRKMADPKVLAALDSLGLELAAMAESALDFVEKVDFSKVAEGLGQARDVAKSLVSAFLGLPPWVQTAVITGWGMNKLTGGALSGIVGELGKGLVKGVLGMNAGVVNLRAGVVNGGGGVGGPVAGGGGKLGAIAGVASKVFLVGAAAGVAAELWGVKEQQTKANLAQGNALGVQASGWAMGASRDEVTKALDGIRQQQERLNSSLTPEGIAYQLNIDGVRTRIDSVRATLETRLKELEAASHTSTDMSVRALHVGFGSVAERTAALGGNVAGMSASLAASIGGVRGAINAIDFSPRITVPVHISNMISNRSITTGQKTIAKYGQVGHL